MSYKNFDLIPGMPTEVSFLLRDSTGLRRDLTPGYTFRLEILGQDQRLLVLKTTPDVNSLNDGIVKFIISGQDGLDMVLPTNTKGNFPYRLILTSLATDGPVSLEAQGYFACSEPVFAANSTPLSGNELLPDGSIYTSVPVIMEEDTWYALSNFWRFVVSPGGLVSIDSRDLTGTILIDVARMLNPGPMDHEWKPDLSGQNAVRIHVVSGSCFVKFYP